MPLRFEPSQTLQLKASVDRHTVVVIAAATSVTAPARIEALTWAAVGDAGFDGSQDRGCVDICDDLGQKSC